MKEVRIVQVTDPAEMTQDMMNRLTATTAEIALACFLQNMAFMNASGRNKREPIPLDARPAPLYLDQAMNIRQNPIMLEQLRGLLS